ncbi:MAG: GntR family transcriptional regulator, partial [Acidobacteria bacterium]|nr:GntR family transcriptional regulator [Acidobacteriota bacterium]
MAKKRTEERAGMDRGLAPGFVDRSVPLYYQLANLLTEKIMSRELHTGDRLPTEVELVEQYGISRITVRQALRVLEQEGLIRREVGRGTFVTDYRPFTGALKVEGSLEDVISLGQNPVRVLDVRTVKAEPDDAEKLGIPVGSPLVRATRIRMYHDEPYSYIVNDLPHEIGKRFQKNDWKGVVLKVIEEKLKPPLREAEQTVRASLADARLAQLLKTKVGAPLLAVERVVRTDHGRVVERVRIHYRSDIYAMKVHLSRGEHPESRWAFA